MVTKESLSSDLDLIKEFESLKLKQSLLLESLKRNKVRNDENELMKDIHSKMSQLLEVFLEVKDSGEKEDLKKDIDYSSNFVQLTEKVDSLESKLNQILKLVKSLEVQKKTDSSEGELPPVPSSWEDKK